jgi:hypothetical protein
VFSPVVFYFRFRGAVDGQTAMTLIGSLHGLSFFTKNNPKEIRRMSHQRLWSQSSIFNKRMPLGA